MPKSILAQVAGVFDASNFAFGVNPAIAPARIAQGFTGTGSQTMRLYAYFIALADGRSFNPFSTNAPLLVGSGSAQETVTPSAVTQNSDGTVSITASFANAHGQGDLVASGTVGLQEAANAANAIGGGVVAVDGTWAQLGGTLAMLQAASLGANASIKDQRGFSDNFQNAAGTADVINPAQGLVIVTKAGVDAMTLAIPTATTQDGAQLTVISTTAQAHTITTPANGIGGSKHIATFAAAINNFITFVAFQGVWYVAASTGITLS